jgi:hypothetical protein
MLALQDRIGLPRCTMRMRLSCLADTRLGSELGTDYHDADILVPLLHLSEIVHLSA